MNQEIFGWSCIVTYRPYGKRNIRTKRIRRRGARSKLVYAARLMNGYQSHTEPESYTRDQWVRAFGNETETGRYRVV